MSRGREVPLAAEADAAAGLRSRPALATLVLCLATLVVGLLRIPGFAGETAPQPARPTVRRVFVPDDHRELWLKGDLQPIPLADLETYLKAGTGIEPHARLLQAEYSAVVHGDTLGSGHLEWTVRHGESRGILSLDPLNLPLTRLEWDTGPAFWGTTPDNRRVLVVEAQPPAKLPDEPADTPLPVGQPADGRLTGNWELVGRRLAHSLLFDVQFPPAAASSLTLDVPESLTVRCSAGDLISRPAATSGFRTWQIRLGGRTRCQLTITPRAAMPQRPVTLVRQSAEYRVRQDSVRFQTTFIPEVLDAPLTELRFQVDPRMDILAITTGDNVSLPWRPADSRGAVLLTLPDPLLGFGPPIRIEGVAHLSGVESEPLPQIRLMDSLLVGGVDDANGGNLVLLISAPLQVREMQLDGYRQSEVSATSNEERIVLRQIRTGANATIWVGRSEFRAAARSHTQIQTTGDQWTATVTLEWTTRAGSMFSGELTIPADWEVTDVRPVGEVAQQMPSDLTGWEIAPAGAEQRLRLHFLDPLSPETKKLVRVSARHAPLGLNQPTAIPTFVPLDVEEVELLVTVTSDAATQAVPEANVDFESIPLREAQAAWPQFDVPAPSADGPDRTLCLRSRLPTAGGQFQLQAERDLVDVQVREVAQVSAGELREEITLHCRPHNGPLKRLLVYLTEPGPPLVWSLDDDSVITVQKLTQAAHATWNVPATGDLWELQFADIQPDEFQIRGVRTRQARSADRIGLAFVPNKREFSGQITASTLAGIPVRFRPRNLTRLSTDGAQWQYEHLGSELGLQQPVGPHVTEPLIVSRFDVRARWVPSGADVYQADLEVRSFSDQAALGWFLPAPANLLDVRFDGRRVVPRQSGERYEVDLPDDPDPHSVQIQYRVPVSATLGPQRRRVVLPRVVPPVDQFRMTLQCPETLRIADPQGLRFSHRNVYAWRERLFGPLAQPRDGVFLPWLKAAWSGENDLLLEGRDSDWTAVAAAPPAEISFAVCATDQLRVATWLCLLCALALGLLIRIVAVRGMGLLRILGMGLSVGAALALPELQALPVGGIVTGFVLAALIPQRRLARLRPQDPIQPPSVAGSVLTSFWFCILLSGALALTIASTLPAQGTTPAAGQPAAALAFDVLIPVDAERKPVGENPLAYVPAQLAKLIREAPRTVLPEYLLAAAHYTVDVVGDESLDVDATFDVQLLSEAGPVLVRLPLTNANLGGEDACTVDGWPQAVLPDPQDRGLLLELGANPPVRMDLKDNPAAADEKTADDDSEPEASAAPVEEATTVPANAARTAARPGLRRIKLRLHPRVDPAAGGGTARLGVPAVLSSRVEVLPGQTRNPVRVLVAGQGPLWFAPAPSTNHPRPLGPAGELDLQWSTERVRGRTNAGLEATVSTLAELYPGWLQLKFRVNYRVLQGQVEAVVWNLPPGIVLRDVQANDLAGHQLQEVDESHRQLLVEFSRPQSGEFAVTMVAVLPWFDPARPLHLPDFSGLLGPPGEESAVPAAPVESGQAAPPVVPSVSAVAGLVDSPPRVILWQLACRQPADYRMEFSGLAPGQFRDRTIDEFLKVWPLDGVRPHAALELIGPAQVQVSATLMKPVLNVQSTQIGKIDRDRLQWSLRAQVTTQTAPVFSYRVEIDPRLRVSSVSVTEEQVEHLLRWSRNADELVLFLNQKATVPQTVRIEATMPYELGQEFPLPFLRFPQAATAESQVAVHHATDVAVQLGGTGPLIRRDAAADIPPTGTDRTLGTFLVPAPNVPGTATPAGATAVPGQPSDPHLLVRVDRNTPEVVVDSATVLHHGEAHWEMQHEVLFRVRTGHVAPLELLIAREAAKKFEWTAQPVLEPVRTTLPDGSARLVFMPEALRGDTLRVRLTVPITPVPTGPWELPEISTTTGKMGSATLLLPRGAVLVDSEGAGVKPTVFPESWRGEFPVLPTTGTWDAYSIAGRPVRLLWPRDEAAVPAVLWADHQVWYGTPALHGRSEFWLAPNLQERFELVWPESLSPTTLMIDGQLQPFPLPTQGRCSIPLIARGTPHVVLISWMDSSVKTDARGFSSHDLSLPVPVKAKPVFGSLTVVPRAGDLLRSTETAVLPPFELALDRWDAALTFAEWQSSNPSAAPPAWAISLQNSARQTVETLAETQVDLAPEVQARLEQLRQRASQRPPPSRPVSRAEEAHVIPATASVAALRLRLPEAPVSIRSMPVSRWPLIVGGICGVVAAFTIWLTTRCGIWRWLHLHENACLFTLGLLWWLTLTPSWFGLTLMVVSLVRKVFLWFWPTPPEYLSTAEAPAMALADSWSKLSNP